MKVETSIATLFCEDIRQEIYLHTLVGILPDNIEIPKVPMVFGKMGVYSRILFDPTSPLKEVDIFLQDPNGQRFILGSFAEFIQQARKDAIESGSPVAGVINNGLLQPFPVETLGRHLAIAVVDGVEQITGMLNFVAAKDVNADQPAEPAEATPPPPAPRPKRTIKKI